MAGKTTEQEVQFIMDVHAKATKNEVSDEDFLSRVNTLYLSGDISEKGLQIAKIMYAPKTSAYNSYTTTRHTASSHC